MVSSPVIHHILYIRTRQANQKMKKTYIRPSAETYTVHAIQMIAAVAFGMKVQYHNRRKVQNFDEAEYVSIDELLQNSDFLLLSAPLTNETFHFINKSSLQKMKKTAILVNIARGPLVNESDLVDALKQQIIAGAALDVYENEPIINEELMNIDNVVLSPHKGTCTIDTRIAMTQEAFKNIINFLKGDEIALVN